MSDFYIKQGDLLPPLEATLEQWVVGQPNASVLPIDLTGCSVEVRIASRLGHTGIVAAAATLVSAADGTVRYNWVDGDTDTAGDFVGEWVITYPSTAQRRVPSNGYFTLTIEEQLPIPPP